MVTIKGRMYGVRKDLKDSTIQIVFYHIAETGEQAIQQRVDEYVNELNIEGRKKAEEFPLLIQQYTARLTATEVIQHPETGEWVPVDWREKRIAEIESQIEGLMAKLKKLREEE